MANVYLQDSTLTAIGDAIRTKAGTTELLLPSEMATAITNIPSGGSSFEKITNMPTLTYTTSGGKGKKNTYTPTVRGDVLTYDVLGFTDLEDFITNGIAMYWVGILPKMQNASNPSGSGVAASMILFPVLGQTIDIERLKSLVANTEICLPVATAWGNGSTTVDTVGGWQVKNSGSTENVSAYGIGTFAFLSQTGITVKHCSSSATWGSGSPAYATVFPANQQIMTLKRA